MTDLLNAALDAHANGLCVLPAANDGTKRPAVPWKQYQTAPPPPEQVNAWFTRGSHHQGLGFVCGAVSGNLELFELEGRAIVEGMAAQLGELADASGLGELWQRVRNGYMELTPGGGVHFLYRVDGAVAGNTKLARRPATAAELAANPMDKVKVLAETRGEAGWVVVAPSGGTTHPTGKPWVLAAGGPATIPTLTPDERDALHHLAGAFDQMPTGQAEPARMFTQPASAYDDGGVSPGTDYNERTAWDEILIPRGWAKLNTDSRGITYWRRPGKSIGFSASTGKNDADNLYVWSTSTEFEAERPYDRFGAYAHLEYGDNHSAAAKALHTQGYGKSAHVSHSIPVVDGNLATVTQLPEQAPHLQVVSESTVSYSDDGNALQLIDHFGDRIRYCGDRDQWLAWDGARWAWQGARGGVVREYAKRIARFMPGDNKTAESRKVSALSARGTAGILTQASTDSRILVGVEDLDAHPWQLNTPGGIVDLTTGTLLPSDPSQLHTRMTAVTPDVTADLGRWEEFLTDTFGEDLALIAYMQRLVGYSAVGQVGPHILPFCHGSGGNGKGAFLEANKAVLGDYAGKAPRGFLTVKMGEPHPQEIAKLAGARMVLCSETNEGDKFDEAKVKELTGGDTLTGHFMRENDFSFKPSHQLWLMGNNKPDVRSGGRSFWRRLRLIGFEREVPEAKVIDDLQGILARDHGAALLAWIAAGAAQYAQTGLRDPQSVLSATAEYQKEQETVDRFVEERCRIGGGEHVQILVAALYEDYEKWCQTERCEPVTKTSFTIKLKKYDVKSEKGAKGVRFYSNISLDRQEDTDKAARWFQ